MIRVAVSGAAGRMGSTVCEAVDAADDLELAGRADPSLDAPLSDVLGAADVVVDFTTPEAARAWLHGSSRYLGGLTPAEAIRVGRFDRVEAALEALDSGVFV